MDEAALKKEHLFEVQFKLDHLKRMHVRSVERMLAIRQETAFAMRPVHQAIHRAFKGNRDGMLSLGVRPLVRPPRD